MSYAKKYIQVLTPYCPPIDNRRKYGGILLDFNERTVPACKAVRDALATFARRGKFNVYPEYMDLPKKIATYAGANEESLMITNGVDQGIDLIFRTFSGEGDKVIIPSPSFAMFYQCAGTVGNQILQPAYGSNGEFPFEEVMSLIDDEVRVIVICNPNNPTGTLVPLKQIEQIAKKAKSSVVLVDEAYAEFSGLFATQLLKDNPNIVITRTFSKSFGLAAFRIGYILTSKENICELEKVRGAYDVNVPACMVVEAALENVKEMKNYVDEVMNKSKPMLEEFFTKNGIRFLPSKSNFIAFQVNNARELAEKLDANGFRLRPQKSPLLINFLRVSIGTVKQTKQFIKAFKKLYL
ncbi:MAG: histidinol-phosphate transaminase [Candidatus Gracilibacteria bacterium]